MGNDKKIRVGLIGNPNVGKTTIFNAVTGARQKTGNWPGVTVEKKTGQVTHKGVDIEVIDLPGTYAITAYSPDEIIARDFILNEKPDVVIQIVDTTNLERNLYLTTQLAEITPNLMLALNLTDFAEAQGLSVDAGKLAGELSMPVVKTVGTRKEGIDELLDAAIELAEKNGIGAKDGAAGSSCKGFVNFNPQTEDAITKISEVLSGDASLIAKYPARWLAIGLLEDDANVIEKVKANADLYAKLTPILSAYSPEEAEADIADSRYTAISALTGKVRKGKGAKVTPSDTLDHVLTDKWLGIPIFLALMCAAFDLTFTFGAPFMTIIETVVGWLAAFTVETIPGMLGSILGDGVISGVGSVLVFLPNICILFFVLSLLEDTGYLARAAFIMDRPLHALGLPGKAFIPMLSGFGCNVPGLMAARTIEDDKDRLLTLLVTPFMSCGARLPIYVLFAGVFFAANAGEVIFSMYLLGIVIAIVSAFIFKRTLFKGEPAPFIMEMPPYRIPTLFAALEHMWSRGELYLRKAGTFILIGAIFVWALASFPVGVEYGSQESYAGALGTAIQPIFEPLDFDWKISVALIFGFVAKEVVVGSLGVLYGADEDDNDALTAALLDDPAMSPVTALTLMVFTLLYLPCIAATAVMRQESGSWKWTGFMIVYTCVTAWIVSFIVANVARLFI